jgi:hypothetical protein
LELERSGMGWGRIRKEKLESLGQVCKIFFIY